MSNASKITLTAPRLQDSAIEGINTKLATRLPWITTCYGAAVRLVGESGFYPAFETNANNSENYHSLLPDSKLGTYLFWDVADGISTDKKGPSIFVKFKAGLVVWGDLRTVFAGDTWKGYNAKNIASAVEVALSLGSFETARLEFENVYFEANNIYKGYNHNEIKNQFLQRPYFGFRIECDVVGQTPCP